MIREKHLYSQDLNEGQESPTIYLARFAMKIYARWET